MSAHDSAIRRIDVIAARFVAHAKPVRFTLATSPTEREAIYRLRASVIIEREWADPATLPDGIERDQYDDRAVHVAGWDGDALVATARLVFPTPGSLLPVEEHFHVTPDPLAGSVNVDRLIVARDASDPGHRLLNGITARCWLELRARGYSVAVGVLTPAIFRLYQQLGWRLTPLGPARWYWGEERIPYRLDPLKASMRRVHDVATGDLAR